MSLSCYRAKRRILGRFMTVILAFVSERERVIFQSGRGF